MNREIIFRGKRADNGKWVEGNLAMIKNTHTGEYNPEIVISYSNSAFDWIEIIPDSIGQFTGLLDKNGKKIFEGDIVKLKNRAFPDINKNNLLAYWDNEDLCYSFKNESKYKYIDIDIYGTYEIELIGNIHDNPELLNDKQ